MPSISDIFPDDPFHRHACAGHPNEDFNMFEELKEPFNGVHNLIRYSMDSNVRFVDVVIAKLEWALEELERIDDDIDPTAVFQGLKDAICAEFDEFYNLYVHAEEGVTTSIHGIHSTIVPFEANSYVHYINDRNKGKVNEMIVTHWYRQGLFDIGDGFVTEDGDEELRDKMTDLRPQYKNLQDIINAVRNCEIELPLHWVSQNRERLGETKASELEFKIHAIKYISMLEGSGARNDVKLEALNYAKANLARFINEHNMDEMKQLCGCVLYESHQVRLVPDSRYSHFFDGSYKQNVIAEIERQFYIMMGQCVTDPLSTVTSVGAKFLSGVCKAAKIVQEDRGCGWAEVGELPLYVNLDEELKFHSHFACAILKAVMANGFNPPVALQCNHVASLRTILGNSTWYMGLTVCPFCDVLTTEGGYKTVYF